MGDRFFNRGILSGRISLLALSAAMAVGLALPGHALAQTGQPAGTPAEPVVSEESAEAGAAGTAWAAGASIRSR